MGVEPDGPRKSRDEKESRETTGTQGQASTVWPPTLDVWGPGTGALAEGACRSFYLIASMIQDFERLLELSEKTAFILYTFEANVHVTVTLGSVLVMSDDTEDPPIVTPDHVCHFSYGTGFIGQLDTHLDRCLVDSGNGNEGPKEVAFGYDTL